MPFFKKVFGSKDAARAAKAGNAANEPAAPPKPHWQESWARKHVQPDEIQELIHVCTHEMKSRGVCTRPPSCRPLLTRPSAGHSLPIATLPTRIRTQRRAQLCAQLLQSRLRRQQTVHRPRTGPGIAPRSATGTTPSYRQNIAATALTHADFVQHPEMVLEQIARRRRQLGRVRAFPHRGVG